MFEGTGRKLRPVHGRRLGRCQARHEIAWESLSVALDLLVETFRADTVELGQIHIQHYP